MNPLRFYLTLALALVIGIGGTVFFLHYRELQRAAAQNEQRGQIIKSTSATISDNDKAANEGAGVDAAVAAATDAYKRGYEDAKRNNPEIAARDERPIPVELRNLAHERRLARERSGRALVGSQAEPQAAPAAQR